MFSVAVQSTLSVPAAACWDKIRDFGGLHLWHPLAKHCRLLNGETLQVGSVREVATPDGNTVVERLTLLDDAQRQLEYVIESAPFPVSDYTGRIEVGKTADGQTEVVWSARFNAPAELEADLCSALTHLFQAGLDALGQ